MRGCAGRVAVRCGSTPASGWARHRRMGREEGRVRRPLTAVQAAAAFITPALFHETLLVPEQQGCMRSMTRCESRWWGTQSAGPARAGGGAQQLGNRAQQARISSPDNPSWQVRKRVVGCRQHSSARLQQLTRFSATAMSWVQVVKSDGSLRTTSQCSSYLTASGSSTTGGAAGAADSAQQTADQVREEVRRGSGPIARHIERHDKVPLRRVHHGRVGNASAWGLLLRTHAHGT